MCAPFCILLSISFLKSYLNVFRQIFSKSRIVALYILHWKLHLWVPFFASRKNYYQLKNVLERKVDYGCSRNVQFHGHCKLWEFSYISLCILNGWLECKTIMYFRYSKCFLKWSLFQRICPCMANGYFPMELLVRTKKRKQTKGSDRGKCVRKILFLMSSQTKNKSVLLIHESRSTLNGKILSILGFGISMWS